MRDRRQVDWALIARHSLAAIGRRPGKSMITATGVALGIAVFIVTVGWSQTVGSQINATFDRLAATELRIRDTQADTATDAAMSDDFATRARQVPGVVAAGRLWQAGTQPVTAHPGAEPVTLTVLAVDPTTFTAAKATVASGRLPDTATTRLAQPIAVLGAGAAHQLGLNEVEPGAAITIDRTRALVMGILQPSTGAPELDDAVLVPTTAPVSPGDVAPPPAQMSAIVRVELGSASQVANALPLAVRPQDPSRLGVLVPPEPTTLRSNVQTSLNKLAYGAAALSLVIGAIGIMNAMLMSVTQRSAEIGLRRSLGAARRHVVAQFLLEGALLGTMGAVVGTFIGEAALIAVALVNGWSPVLDQRLLLAAPAAGLVIGVGASLYPALRAATIDPAATLRT